ncbi:MAG: hypothetical protein EP297_01755 [Gammaproteobacteria bacterium]|nr:MAG: hypothetical protein EP297_01755 [Gammaproteobacteria bacterium]
MSIMIYVLIGTKAQLIKMAPVMRALDDAALAYEFVLTGQHAETMEDLISDFNLRDPDWYFVKPSEADTVHRLLTWIIKAFTGGFRGFSQCKPGDLILVHGDTVSTLIGAILGKLKRIKVVHVEAGLRSFNYLHPFPEEIVRVLTTRLSDYFICQDSRAVQNLMKIRIPSSSILNTGANTLLDSLRIVSESSTDKVDKERDPYCIVTLHRSENITNQERFDFLMSTVNDVSERIKVLFVMHPVTRKKLQTSRWLSEFEKSEHIELLARMPYTQFVKLMKGALFMISDGGSNQEESSYLGLPCLLMRKATERHEGIGGNVVLSNYDIDVINSFIDDTIQGRRMDSKIKDVNPSKQIAEFMSNL